MDFDLTPEQEAIRKLARDFADREIAPGARERDRAERFPADVLSKMAPVGFLGGPVPEQYGGMGVDYISHAIITEEIGRADSSVRTTLSVQISLVELTILKWGTEEQKRTWLPRLCKGEVIACFALTEPAVGSDATRLQATAKRDGNDWVLNGRKTWISNGSVSKLALVFANADPSRGHRAVTPSPPARSARRRPRSTRRSCTRHSASRSASRSPGTSSCRSCSRTWWSRPRPHAFWCGALAI